MSPPDRASIGPLARDDGEPAFEEPWQAQVLALAFALAEGGLFTNSEWSDALGEELRRRARRGEPDLRPTFFAAALSALERLVTAGGMVTEAGLDARTELWRRAYLHTPHGRPVEIDADRE